MTKLLKQEILKIDWIQNRDRFLAQASDLNAIDEASTIFAFWAKQIETLEGSNSAIAFLRSAQASNFQAIATCSVGLYPASAAATRGIVEGVLYYSYFRTHHSELATLVRDRSYYVSRADVIEYHKRHTPEFKKCEQSLGLLSRLDNWYGGISAIVHGQIPGKWVSGASLGAITSSQVICSEVCSSIQSALQLAHELLLVTVGREFWERFESDTKVHLTKGLAQNVRGVLGFDKA